MTESKIKQLALGMIVALVLVTPSVARPVQLGPAEFYWLMDRACGHGDDLAVEMLLSAGADPSGPKDYEAFLAKYNKPFEPSWHLCQAAYGGHVSVIKLLLEAGADPNLAQGEGVTALTLAAEHGHAEIVQLLLEAGADKHYRTFVGTAAELAARNGHDDVESLLRSYEP